MRMKLAAGLCLSSVLVFGCGSSDSSDSSAAGAGAAGTGAEATAGPTSGSGGAGASGGSGVGGELAWSPIITADWSLAPGTEKTSDVHTIVLDHDVYIGAIRPIAPVGTHHTVLALDDLSTDIIYASGVNTNAIIFPPGVGLKIAAGQTLILQLHLFNPSGEQLTGTSGIEVVEVEPSEVEQEADLFLPGPLDFALEPNQETSVSSTCTLGVPQSVFAIFPHMHQLGTHFKATLTVGGTESVLHDDDYQFDHQAFIPFDPVALDQGDSITTQCTWNNTKSVPVGWGESSESEMCFSIMYRYPAQNGSEFCLF
jgi:hypothetical protein